MQIRIGAVHVQIVLRDVFQILLNLYFVMNALLDLFKILRDYHFVIHVVQVSIQQESVLVIVPFAMLENLI
jgi:hypothetical protein